MVTFAATEDNVSKINYKTVVIEKEKAIEGEQSEGDEKEKIKALSKKLDDAFSFEKKWKKYTLADIEYELASEEPMMEDVEVVRERTIEGLKEKTLNEEGRTWIIQEQGEEVLLLADTVNYENDYKKQKVTVTETKDLGFHDLEDVFNVEDYYKTTYTDPDTKEEIPVELELKKMTWGEPVWKPGYTYPMKVKGYGALEYDFDGQTIKEDDITNSGKLVLNSLGLSSKTNRIDSITWQGQPYTKNGIRYRNAIAKGSRMGRNYTAVYEKEIEVKKADGYKAKVIYKGTIKKNTGIVLYTVKAKATYINKILEYAMIFGCGLAILCGTVILILFILSKKRKKEEKEVA